MGNIQEDAIVVRHNMLITSRHKLTLQENRLLLWLISQIKIEDTEFTSYQIGAKELADFIGIEGQNIYVEMKKTTKLLLSRVVEIEDAEYGYVQFQIVSRARYRGGILELRVHEEMRPLLLQLKENFTKVELKYAMRFSGTYAARIYDILKLNKFKRTSYNFELSLDELREILGLQPEQYTKFPNFRARILEPAQKEINTKTDTKVEYGYIKTGRKITGINFQVTPQGANIPFLPKSANDKLFKKLEKLGFNAKDGARLIEKYKDDPERITFAIEYVKNEVRQDKGIRNPAGLLRHVIEEDRRPQTSFKDELFKDDKSKREQQKKVQVEIAKFEQEINALSSRIEDQSGQYQNYRTQEIVSAVEKIETEAQQHHKTEFSKTLDSSVVKDMFAKKGWTHRLLTRDTIEYLQGNGFLGQVLKQEDWEREQGFKTREQIEEEQKGIEQSMMNIRKIAQKSA